MRKSADLATLAAIPGAVDPAAVAAVRAAVLDADDAARLSSLLSLMADPVRVRLLDALETVEELSVGDLALALEISEDAASYGLRLLRTAGLLQSRKEGRLVRYRLTDRFPEPLLEHCMRELLHLSRLAAGMESDPDGSGSRSD
jgi:DNA-binding transcriptional ArsR family regulator